MFKKETNSFTLQTRLELEALAVKSIGFTAVISFVLSLIYGIIALNDGDRSPLLFWLFFMFMVLCLRIMSQKLLHQIDLTAQSRDRRFYFFKLMTILSGVGWSSVSIFLFSENDPYQQMVLICLLLGVAAGALSSMTPVIGLCKTYIILLLVPLIIRLFYEANDHFIALAALTCFYFVTLLVMAGKIYDSLSSSIYLRLENEALLRDVFVSKERVEKVNVDLRTEVEEHQKARLKLEEERERAEQATLVKSQFMTNMSHELKTPMTGIVGVCRQLRQTSLGIDQKNLLQKLNESSGELLFLIDNLLDFSELESGDLSLNEQPFNLKLLLEELVLLFKPQAEKKGLAFHLLLVGKEQFHETSLSEWLVGDQLRLKQILFNLLNNAIKFTRHGSVEISLDVTEGSFADEKGDFVLQFCVKDTGQGIVLAKQDEIFSAFQQADNSLTRTHGGTGVGLAIAKKMVDLMAGRIWCESVEGEGSKFYVQVSFEIAEKPVEAHVEISSCRQYVLLPKILVVDDNVLNRELLGAMLNEKNLKPSMAGDGLEALEILAQENFDLIFMDIQMPVLNGVSATRIVRCLEAGENVQPGGDLPAEISLELLTRLQTRLINKHTVVVTITANLVHGVVQEYLDAGMDDSLGKPFQAEKIFELIKNYFPSCTALMEQLPDEADSVKGGVMIDYRAQAVQFLRENYYLDDSAIETMLETLARSLSANFKEAQQALADNNLVQLGQTVHSLKGSLANLGFSELAEKAREIETGVRDQPNLPYKEMVARLKDCLSEFM